VPHVFFDLLHSITCSKVLVVPVVVLVVVVVVVLQ